MNTEFDKKAGIYIHIPFCRQICPYCDFYSEAGRENRIVDFTSAIAEEARLRAAEFSSWKFDTVFFGGGTPSLLEPSSVERILNSLQTGYSISPDAEITLESNPSSIGSGRLSEYRRVGINRLSIGIQSFSDTNLKTLGRIHDSKAALESFDDARRGGFYNINIDLIYGLPGQQVHPWIEDLSTAVSLNPEHISAYNLTIEPNTPFGAMFRDGSLVLPSDDEQREMYYSLNDELTGAGYERYEISNFARPGKQCLHNLKYWTNSPYLGLGPSAVTCNGSRRSKIVSNLDEYMANVEKGGLWVEFEELIDSEKAMEERVMMGLRMTEGLSLSAFKSEFGIDIAVEKKSQLDLLEKRGLIRIDNDKIKITREGLFVSDDITVRLI